jgi:hypothetical protein
MAFRDLVADKFKFENTKSFTHPYDETVNQFMEECSGKYYSQWSADNKAYFDMLVIPVTVYRYEMDYTMKTDFFADLQNTVPSSSGEDINTLFYKKIIRLINDVMANYDITRIWSNGLSRHKHLQVFTTMAYYYLANPESTVDVSNDTLFDWVDAEGDEVDDVKFGEFVAVVHKTLDFMCDLNVPYKSAKNNIMGFFFLFSRNTDPTIISRIRDRFEMTKKIVWPEMMGKNDQGWRKYTHLITSYIS